ncbi:MAG: PQQ-like beta-propeller repeat protein [Caldisericia bacterium]|nr:PQQ-like beta-propeller repeat protein [Caldisericia bacterium]
MKRTLLVLCSFIILGCISCVSNSKPTQKPVNTEKENTNASSSNTDSQYPKTDVVAWKYGNIDNPMQPVIGDGKLFVGEESGNLRCFDAFTGKSLWEEKLNIIGNPVYSNGNLIFKQMDGTLLCIESETRKKVWSTKIAIGSSVFPFAENGSFVINNNNDLVCFDEKTGRKLWVKASAKPLASSNGQLYYYHQGELYCVKIVDGNLIWKLECPDPIRKIVTYGNKLFFDDYSSKLYCIDDNGRETWKSQFAKQSDDYGSFGLTYCVVNETVYAIDDSYNLYCLDAGSGKKLSSRPMAEKHKSSITFFDGCIYYCYNNGICIEDITDRGRSVNIRLHENENYSNVYYMNFSIAYGNIYYVSDNVLICINAATGTGAIAYKQSETSPVQILNDEKYWVGKNNDNIAIFKNDKLLWKNTDKLLLFYLDNDKAIHYLDYDNYIVYIGYDKEARIYCIDKKTGRMVWEKPQGDFIITGYDKKTVTLCDNYSNMQTVDVASGKSTFSRLALPKKELDEFTDFAIPLVYGPGEFSFYKINDHQYLIHQYRVGGKGLYELGLFVANSDGSVLYGLYGTSDNDRMWELNFLSYCISNDKNKLFVRYHFSDRSETFEPISKEVDLITGKVSNYTAQDFPQDAVDVDLVFTTNDNQDPNSIVKGLAFQGERISDVEFEKKTGLKPLEFKKSQNEYEQCFAPSATNYIQKLNNSTICYRVIDYPSPDRGDVVVDYFNVFDTKTWKSLWSCKGVQTNIMQVGDKYLLVKCEKGISLVDTDTGKDVYRIENATTCSIVDNLLFVAQRNKKNRSSVVIKAVNLEKLVDKNK